MLRATGRSLGEVAEERIFGPLGMEETHFHADHRRVVARRATGYGPAPDGGFRVSQTTLPMVGDGGVFTSVTEIVRWVANLMEPVVGGVAFQEMARTRGLLTDGETLDYAFGLTHGVHRGLPTIGHGGSFVGYRASVLTYPDQGLGIATLCNRSDANPSRMSRAVGEVLLGELMEPVSERPGGGPCPGEPSALTEVPLSGEEADAFVGIYHSPELDTSWTIEAAGGSLRLAVGNSLD